MNEKDKNNFRIIAERLARLKTLWRAMEAARGAAAALIALMVPNALGMVAGATGAPRAAIVLSAFVISFSAVVCLFVVPLVRPLTLKDIALLVERKHSSLSGKAVNCVELFSDAETGKAAFDLGRLSSLLEETVAEMSHFSYSEALNMPGMRKSLIALAAAGAVVAAALAIGDASPSGFVSYMSPPYLPVREKIKLQWITGDIVAPVGSEVAIEARLTGVTSGIPVIILERAGLGPRVEKMESARAENGNVSTFVFKVGSLPGDMSYSVEYKNFQTRKYTVKAVEPPGVRSVSLKIIYPSHTGLKEERRSGGGDIKAPFGSQVFISAEATSPLRSARLLFDNEDETELAVDGASAEGSFDVERSGRYEILLTDENGFINAKPPRYVVESVADEPPEIAIIKPENDIDANKDSIVVVRGESRDDYRVDRVSVHYRAADSGRHETVQINARPGKELLFEFRLDLKELGVYEGETLEYFLSATDNDALTGPKTARSEIRRVRVLSKVEDYREILAAQEDIEMNLEALLGEGRSLAERTEEMARNLSRELREDGGRKWTAETERAVERTLALDSELAQLSKRLEETVERMRNNEFVNLETVSKMNELNKLMQEIMTDEIRELVEKIRKQLESARFENTDALMMQAMKERRAALDNLDRTIQKMKRVREEQKLAAASARFKELEERQESLLDRTQALNEAAGDRKPDAAQCSEAAAQSREQARIHDGADSALDYIEALAEEMEGASPETADALKSAAETAGTEKLKGRMAGARDSLGRCSLKKAADNERAALETLRKMNDKLKGAAGEFAAKMSAKEKEMIRRLLRGTLDVSAAHEATRAKTEKMMERTGARPSAPEFKKAADEQQLARLAAETLAQDAAALASFSLAVSQNAPLIAAEAARALARSVESFSEMKLDEAASSQNSASLRLNQLAVSLLDAEKRAGMESSASELESFMGRLRQLADSQQALNEATERLGESGLPIPQMSAGMQSLAMQQKLIGDGLGQLMDDMGNVGGMSERLKQISEEMEMIRKDMEGGRITVEVKRRQSNALRRLRESALSLRKESLEEKRVAESAKEYVPAISPKAIDVSRDLLPEHVLRQIENLKGEPAPEGFEGIIENYYKELLKGE